MFDLACEVEPQMAFSATASSGRSRYEPGFRLLPQGSFERHAGRKYGVLAETDRDLIASLVDIRAIGGYSEDFIREVIRVVLRRYRVNELSFASLDLYLIMEVARDCWKSRNPDVCQPHSEELRSFAYALAGGLAKVSEKLRFAC